MLPERFFLLKSKHDGIMGFSPLLTFSPTASIGVMLVFGKNTVTAKNFLKVKASAPFQHSEITSGYILLIILIEDDVWDPFKIIGLGRPEVECGLGEN